jgi:superfamily II DNA or RNA helicase
VDIEANMSFTALLSSLSPDPLTRGKQFERLSKWWITQDPIRSLDVKQVWLWDEWPEYPGRDIGIDLVAEMFDGTLCAIQAKCFDENRDIPKSELDSFISAASQHTFQHRWLIASTDRLSANARRMLDDQHVVRIMRSDLEASLDSWPSSIDELNPIPQPKSTPRPHQDLAIKDVVKGLKEHDRGQLIMACGTGKTLTALWIKETLRPRTTLVLVPSLNLLAQTLAEWAKNMSSPWNYLCVCSDDTVNKADDQPISTVGDLPFDVTTNSEQIASFLQLGGEKIIFSTYQSSAQVAKAQEGSGTTFDLVICDEAHRLTGKTDADYATVLDEKKLVAEKRLFMTATPRTYTSAVKTKAEERGVEITSMDDEHIYGPVLHKLSFGEAIKQKLLSDYRVLIVGVTDPQVQDLIDRRELVTVNDAINTDARTLAAHIGLAKATKDYNLKRTISFHSRIKTADQFARDHAKILEWLPESHKPSGETSTGTISGAMNTGDRRRLIKQLSLDGANRHALLTNARCLTEGVDVPSLDGVAFIDPRSSQVDIIQAVGRAIRKSENKEIGTIVLPVLIPTDSDAEDAIEDTTFKPIWAVLNALKSHDDELQTSLNHLRTELGRTGKVQTLPDKIYEDWPEELLTSLPHFLETIRIEVLEHTTQPWSFWFGKLESFAEENGHARPITDKKNRSSLSHWVSKQRSLFSAGELDREAISKLESLRGWSWSVHDDNWLSTYEVLKKFIEDNNGLDLLKSLSINGVHIGGWSSRQRIAYAKGELESVRIQLLEALPGWTWDPNHDSWMAYYSELRSLSVDFMKTGLPSKLISGDFNLGNWITFQRKLKRQNGLEQYRIDLLQEIPGWIWDPDEKYWDLSYSALVEFVDQNNHCMVPAKLVVGEVPLGRWVTNQRVRYKKNKLSKQRIEELEKLRGWSWDARNSMWQEAFNLLEVFALREGHAVPLVKHFENGFLLGGWVVKQRSSFSRGQLTQDQIDRLNGLPGWSWKGDLGRAAKEPVAIAVEESLGFMHPEISGEFDLEKNAPFSPSNLKSRSSRKMWWTCSVDSSHQWKTAVSNRTTRSSGCPHCWRIKRSTATQ